ncbi:MAG: glycosyltransferase [Sphingobacteriales bacterium]|nr:MAG: glycosyltransferase [Sphingobacteriales bacterium]
MILFLLTILLLNFAVLAYCNFHINRKHFLANVYMQNEENLPFVSILVAARNEEKNILNCLESLSKLNYAKSKYEVLIGDDSSTDKTAKIVANFIHKKSKFILINIEKNVGQVRGKANVLAQLAREAKGEYFFITDADMQVPESWIQSHLKHFSAEVYITSGTTLTSTNNSIFSKLQYFEWLYLMGLFNSIDNIKPITAMGNNMGFRADKYFEIGGYENMPFSVTEDIQLMNEFATKGYKHKHILHAENLSWQEPLYSISDLLKQRKRWFQGGKKQPFYIWILFIIYAAFLPALLTLFYFNLQLAIYILLGKCFVDSWFLFSISNSLKVKINLLWLPVFEAYLFIINPLILVYSLFSQKVIWKDRKY